MEKYIEPKSIILEFEMTQVLCASFDSLDHTENWFVDDEETI